MNGIEQRNHRTRTAEIANNVERIAHAMEQRLNDLDVRLVGDGRALRQQIGDERTHRLNLANEQRAYVDAEDRKLRRSVEHVTLQTQLAVSVMRRGFWGRLKWLVVGR